VLRIEYVTDNMVIDLFPVLLAQQVGAVDASAHCAFRTEGTRVKPRNGPICRLIDIDRKGGNPDFQVMTQGLKYAVLIHKDETVRG
jgi:hypothetical protein